MIDDEVYNMEYLLVLRIENLRPFRHIANSLEDGCLPRIGAANDEYAKVRGAASKIARSSLLSFYVLCSLRFNIGKRHLSLRCLRWWKWWRIKISVVGSVLFGFAGQPQEWRHWLTFVGSSLKRNFWCIHTSLTPHLSFSSLNLLTTIVKAHRFVARSDH